MVKIVAKCNKSSFSAYIEEKNSPSKNTSVMKRIVSILTFAILAVTLSAQNLVAVSGAVCEISNGSNPAPYAKVELLTPDGKIVVNTQCDNQGNYRLQAPACRTCSWTPSSFSLTGLLLYWVSKYSLSKA